MELQTKYHGIIQVDESSIIRFENGIPGFIEEKQFILLPFDNESPFFILQSVSTSELGFVVVNPFLFNKEYEFDLSDHDKQSLHIQSEKDIQVYTILTVKDPFSESTANLQAPIIYNHKENLAKQIILQDTYKTRHKLFANATKG